MFLVSLYRLRAAMLPPWGLRGPKTTKTTSAATDFTTNMATNMSTRTMGDAGAPVRAVTGVQTHPDLELHPGQPLAPGIQDRRAIADTLPSLVDGPRAVGWWGIVFLVLIELVVFTSFIVSYFYLRSYAPRWPAGGIEAPDLFLPTLNTIILIASALPIYWASRSIRRGNRSQFLIGLLIGIGMAILFLVLKYVEYSDKGYNWTTNAYASSVWTMTGFHIAHVVAVLLKSCAIWVVGLQGFFDERRHVAVEGNSLYWYFVIVIWIPLYLTIYISPRVM